MEEVIVVAYNGGAFLGPCLASLPGRVVTVDTGHAGPRPGQHPTGAYLWAYENVKADRYLFIQDSMTAISPDPCGWFRERFTGSGAVAWGLFGINYDTPEQAAWVRDQYPGGDEPAAGIFGPVFYTDRPSLDILASKGLLPRAPTNRIEAQGTERAWAWAYENAGLAVAGPAWDKPMMEFGFGPFKKTWAARP